MRFPQQPQAVRMLALTVVGRLSRNVVAGV